MSRHRMSRCSSRYFLACSCKESQLLYELQNVWEFAVDLDSATVISSSEIEARVRFYDSVQLRKYHVLVIQIYEKDTAEAMFNLISTLLHSLVGEQWKSKLIVSSTDGAANMVGKISGAVTRV